MFVHLLNLLTRSIVTFPTILSSNWLSILLPLAIFLIKDGWSMIRKYRQQLPLLSEATKRDAKIVGVVYLVLLGASIVKTIYQDHQYFVDKAREFRGMITSNKENFQSILEQRRQE